MRVQSMSAIAPLVLCCLFACPGLTAGAVWYVATDGNDVGDGSSGSPFATIQHGLNVAAPGDSVKLADGIYSGGGNRDLSFLGKSLVLMSISDSPESCIVDCGGSAEEQHRGLLFSSGEDRNSKVKGLTIRNGYAGYGGAVLCLNNSGIYYYYPDLPQGIGGHVRLVNCIIKNNTAINFGGGVAVIGPSSATMTECRIIDNTGDGYHGDLESENADCEHCLFANNSGNGAWFGHGELLTITDCEFSGNGGHGLANYSPYGALYKLYSVSSHDNVGYGIYDDGNSETWYKVYESEISENDQGGIYHQGSLGGALEIYDSCISNNGGVGVESSASEGLDLHDTVIMGNSGSGVRYEFSDLSLEHVQITDNGGPGLYVLGTTHPGWGTYSFVMTDVTIANNVGAGYVHRDDGAPDMTRVLIAGNGGPAIDAQGTDIPSLSCCDLFGNIGGDWIGNISTFYGVNGNDDLIPLFCDAASLDYSLQENSPLLSDDAFPCGTPGATGQGCPMPVSCCRDLQVYDPVTREPSTTMMNIEVLVEGIVSVAPGTYAPGTGGYISCGNEGINFWSGAYEVVPVEGDFISMVGPIWDDADGELYIGYPEITILDSGLALTPTIRQIDELLSDLSLTGAFVEVQGAVTNLGPDAFDLRTGAASMPIVRRVGTNVSFAHLAEGNIVSVTSPCIHGATAQYLAPRRADDLVVISTTGTGDTNASLVPEVLTLLPCSPNPFNPSTALRFDLPIPGNVNLMIYDIGGKTVRTLISDTAFPAGRHEVYWHGGDDLGRKAGTGLYFVVLESGDRRLVQRAMLLK